MPFVRDTDASQFVGFKLDILIFFGPSSFELDSATVLILELFKLFCNLILELEVLIASFDISVVVKHRSRIHQQFLLVQAIT